MKTTITLFTSKVLKNGESPVMLRTFENGKYKYQSIGVSCKKENWTKANRVSSRDRRYEEKNAIIERYLNQINEVKLDVVVSDVETIEQITNRYCKEHKLAYNSVRKYDQMLNTLGEKRHLPVSKMDINMLLQLIEDSPTESSTRENTLKFKAIFAFAKEDDLVKGKLNIDVPQYIPKDREKNILTPSEISIILNFYKKQVDALGEDFKKENSIQHQGLCLWIMCFAFQGIAPVDLMMLKKSDIHIDTINSIEFNAERALNEVGYREWFAINNVRTKVIRFTFGRMKLRNGKPVDVVCDYDSIAPVFDYYMSHNTASDFFINCFFEEPRTEKRRQEKIQQFAKYRMKGLNKRLKEFCKNFDFPEIRKFTLYSSRKAFINKLYDMGIKENIIQKFVGHTNVINEHYIKPLTALEQANITKMIFNIDDLKK